MRCEHCGSEQPSGHFCEACGLVLTRAKMGSIQKEQAQPEAPESPQTFVCRYCQQAQGKNRFCEKCGMKMDLISNEKLPEETSHRCRQCGISSKTSVCRNCGLKIPGFSEEEA